MNSQITLLVTVAVRGVHSTVEILVDGDVALSSLRPHCLKAVGEQHPHLLGSEIVVVRYDVRSN